MQAMQQAQQLEVAAGLEAAATGWAVRQCCQAAAQVGLLILLRPQLRLALQLLVVVALAAKIQEEHQQVSACKS